MRSRLIIPALLGAALCVVASPLLAAKPKENGREVELFAAMEAGEVEVQFIPKDATKANVLIRNKTDRPLSVRLPAAFAGVPVAAQFGGGGLGGGLGGGGLGGGLGGGGLGGGGGQGLGGGFGGGGLGGGGLGGGGFGGGGLGGGGLFNVAPEKVGKVKVTTVCLEHGKPDPNPRMKYTIVPIEKFTKDPAVIELCKLVGAGKIPQNTGQAAAWHYTDKLSWVQLAQKNRVELMNGYTEKFFSPAELRYALQVVAVVDQRVRQLNQSESQFTSATDSASDASAAFQRDAARQ